MVLHPSPPSIDVPAVGGFYRPPEIFRFGLRRTHEIGTGSAETPAAPTAVAHPSPSTSPTQGTDSVETTGPTASAPAPPGSPVPPTVKPSSDRMFTRTRRHTATAAGTAPPAVDYGFGPDGTPRASARRHYRHFPRPRPGPPTAAKPAPPASSVPTVSIQSDRDRGEPVGTPLLRPTPLVDDTTLVPLKLDAPDDAAELQFADSVARYSRADWKREQQAERTDHAAMRYSTVGPASRIFVVLPSSQQTVYTAGCGLVRNSVSSLGTTGSVFWRRAMLMSHVRSGSVATAIRCFPRELTFGTMATMGCGGSEKSVRVRRRMGNTWSDFWTIRGRSSSSFSRRTTRPQWGPYEVLGA